MILIMKLLINLDKPSKIITLFYDLFQKYGEVLQIEKCEFTKSIVMLTAQCLHWLNLKKKKNLQKLRFKT